MEIDTIDKYLEQFSGETRARLDALRAVVAQNAPQAREKISWRMPTFYQNGNLIHFAAFKNHIGIYPGAAGVERFALRFEGCKTSKGAIQLPNSAPLPLELIGELVRFLANENA